MALQKLDSVPAYVQIFSEEDRMAASVKPKWSGSAPPPSVGAVIKAKINNIGDCKVTGYAVYEGWLAVMCYPLNPPDWWVKQNGKGGPGNSAMLFGAEIVL